MAGGCSVDYNGPGCDEAAGEMVRAFLWPSCIVARPIPGIHKATTLQWILDVDFKGWVPRCVLDTILPFSQVCVFKIVFQEYANAATASGFAASFGFKEHSLLKACLKST